jgi:hypothetical protein
MIFLLAFAGKCARFGSHLKGVRDVNLQQSELNNVTTISGSFQIGTRTTYFNNATTANGNFLDEMIFV